MVGKRDRPAVFKDTIEKLRWNFVRIGKVENLVCHRRQFGEFCLEAISASVCGATRNFGEFDHKKISYRNS
jgi:hypothetical protein